MITLPHEQWAGIPTDRIVAVVARLPSGKEQIGSGYLVGPGLVLTAAHCTWDFKTRVPPMSLRVYRKSDGAMRVVRVVNASAPYDVAVLDLDVPLGPTGLPPPSYGRVDQTHGLELEGCEAIGYPLFQYDPVDQQRNSAQIKGTIRTSDDAELGYLLLRDALLESVTSPKVAGDAGRDSTSAWGGLSGALVFHQGLALGIVIEHHPRQGASALRLAPFSVLAGASDRDTRQVADALGLVAPELLIPAGNPSVPENPGDPDVRTGRAGAAPRRRRQPQGAGCGQLTDRGLAYPERRQRTPDGARQWPTRGGQNRDRGPYRASACR